MKITFLIISISLLYSCINRSTTDNNQDDRNILQESSIPSKTTCSICGNEFEGNGYEEVSDGVWTELKDPFTGTICSASCGRKHTQEFNDIANSYGVDLNESNSSNQNGDDYEMGSDGRVYETNACSMCKGTGIEENRSSFSDELGRICPMCDGKGVRSY